MTKSLCLLAHCYVVITVSGYLWVFIYFINLRVCKDDSAKSTTDACYVTLAFLSVYCINQASGTSQLYAICGRVTDPLMKSPQQVCCWNSGLALCNLRDACMWSVWPVCHKQLLCDWISDMPHLRKWWAVLWLILKSLAVSPKGITSNICSLRSLISLLWNKTAWFLFPVYSSFD